jgi:nitrogen regulatory protein PII 2
VCLGGASKKASPGEIACELPEGLESTPGRSKYVPKRLVSLIVPDEDADLVVKAIIKVNQTNQFGDGRVFVCPIENVVRIRTDEEGEAAIK